MRNVDERYQRRVVGALVIPDDIHQTLQANLFFLDA
jgi:hypothetical protein